MFGQISSANSSSNTPETSQREQVGTLLHMMNLAMSEKKENDKLLDTGSRQSSGGVTTVVNYCPHNIKVDETHKELGKIKMTRRSASFKIA